MHVMRFVGYITINGQNLSFIHVVIQFDQTPHGQDPLWIPYLLHGIILKMNGKFDWKDLVCTVLYQGIKKNTKWKVPRM